MLGRVDPQRFLVDPERRVAGDVQSEQAGRPDSGVMADPDQQRGQRQVPDQLVQEGGLEGRVARVAVRMGDDQGPRKGRGLAVELLVEVVADPADGLGDEQCGSYRVGERRETDAMPPQPPDARERPARDAAPDPQTAGPDREGPVPHVRDVGRGGQVEVDPAADDARGHGPQRDVGDDGRVTARRAHPALGDDHRERDSDHVHQAVEVHEQGPDQGTFMTLLARLTGAASAVEVGTFTGYSAICIARGLAHDGRLLCCDVSEEWTSVARGYWKRAGLDDKIDLRLGPAARTLRDLPAGTSFDYAFIDADKTGYVEYWDLVVPMIRPGGLVLVDNTLSHGRVVDLRIQEDSVQGIRRFNGRARADDRVDLVLLPIGDGLTMARKR